MGANFDIYGTRQQFDRYKRRIEAEPEITPSNKQAIFEFFDYGTATGLSLVRLQIYATRLYALAKLLGKDFKSADKQDIQRVMAQIEGNAKLAVWTKQFYKVTLKKFYKWLEGNGEEYPEKVKWIKTSMKNSNRLLPEQLLTQEEVMQLISAAENPRDKALISVLAESGCRIGELAGLKIKHVSFDQHGAQLMVNGKTGMRRVRLLYSVHYLTNWLDSHPEKKDLDAPLWIRLTTANRGLPLNYANIRSQLVKISIKAGITKPVNPHSFRHSRATQLAKLGLNQAQLSAHFGWVQGTDMAQTYIHLSGQDTDEALLRAYGLKRAENKDEDLPCARCGKHNEITARFCKECGMPLTISAAFDLEEKRQEFDLKIGRLMELLEDSEVKEFLAQKLAKKIPE